MLDLGTLSMKIAVDADDAKQELNDFQEQTDSTGDSLGGGFNVNALKAAAGVAAITTAVVAATKEFLEFESSVASTGDDIDKNSQRLLMSREAYQQWDYILSQNGSSIDSFSSAIRILNNNLSEGSEDTISAVEALGYSFDELSAMQPEDRLMAIITGLQGVTDANTKTELANDLLGRSYQEFMPLLNSTAEDTQALIDNFNTLSLGMSDEAVDASVDYTDAMDTMNRSFQSLGNEIGALFLPILQGLAEWVTEWIPYVRDFVSSAIDTISSIIDGLMSFIIPIADELYSTFSPLIDAIGSVVVPIFETLGSVISVIFEGIKVVLQGVATVIQAIWNNVVKPIIGLITSAVQALQGVIETVCGAVTTAFNAVGDALTWVWNHTIQPIIDLISSAAEAVGGFFNTVGSWFGLGSSDVSVSVDGSHRNGLTEVPYDGYIAELHKGEMILTAEQANDYQKQQQTRTGESYLVVNNYSPTALNEAETARLYRQTQRKIALGF